MDCESETCRNANFKSGFRDSKFIPSLRPAGMPSPSLGSWILSLRSTWMPSPSFESKTSRDSRSESELIMDSKSGSGFMDCDSKTCRNAKFKSGFIDSESEISRDAKSEF